MYLRDVIEALYVNVTSIDTDNLRDTPVIVIIPLRIRATTINCRNCEEPKLKTLTAIMKPSMGNAQMK